MVCAAPCGCRGRSSPTWSPTVSMTRPSPERNDSGAALRLMPQETRKATCYLLVGGADGALDVSLQARDGRIGLLSISAPSGFGGMIWKVVAQMLADAPLERDAL